MTVDFAGQVAVVTGGGRGLGRAYAQMLSSRGAAIVVNDLGTPGLDGSGGDSSIAEEAASGIRAAGGRAVASGHDVTTPEGGAAIVEMALAEFGQLDILIHNAGIIRGAPFGELSLTDFHAVMAVHVGGALHVGQPAWRHMLSRGYGRIVLTTSGAVFGLPGGVPYCTAKAGLIGMARALKHEAAGLAPAVDLKINVVGPLADTRMGGPSEPIFGELADPDMVAAVVTYLVSRECELNGEVVQAGGSHFAKLFIGQSRGWAKGAPSLTAEDVGAHMAEALDTTEFSIPDGILDQIRAIGEVALGDAGEVDVRFNAWVASMMPADGPG